MEAIIFRFAKAVIMAVAMFFCASVIGFSGTASVAFAMAVFFLGIVAILDALVYAIVGLFVITAAMSTLLPEGHRNLFEFAQAFLQEFRASLARPQQ
jgi:hypothetical protein